MRRPGWLAALLVLIASASLSITASAGADTSPEQRQLVVDLLPGLDAPGADRRRNCNTTEEQYNPPTTVNSCSGTRTVKLVHYVGGKDVPIKKGAHRGRHRRPRRRLLPGPSGRSPRRPLPAPGSYATDFAGAQGRRQGARRSPTPTSPREPGHSGPRRPVLLLLLLQPVQRRARGRLGGHADRLRRRHARRRPWRDGPSADRPLPARRRRAGRTGMTPRSRRTGPIRSSIRPPDRTRPSSTTRSTSRTARTARAWAATTPRSRCVAVGPGAGHRAHGRGPRQRVPVAELPRALGTAREGLQQRPAGADHQEAVAAAVHLDGRDPPGQPAAAGRSDPGAGRLDRVLRRDRGRLGVHQPRGQDHARGDRTWRWPCFS